MSSLEDIVNAKRLEVKNMKQGKIDFIKSISRKKINLICEIKLASPSQGTMRSIEDIETHLDAYKKYAAAISILTDKQFFGGGYEILKSVKELTGLPVLQKDFVIDESQIIEGLKYGADAVLIIVKILKQNELERLVQFARGLGIEPVIEINNEDELARVQFLNPALILVNNRNLDSLEIDMSTTERIANKISKEQLFKAKIISASGYHNFNQIEANLPYADIFLIGSSLMKESDPSSKLQELSGLNVKQIELDMVTKK